MPAGFSEEEQTRIRQDLLRQGEQIFARQGVRKTTIDQLTGAAGIAKGSFYRFFPTKEALFIAILDDIERRERTRIREILEITESNDPTALARLIFETAAKVVERHPVLAVVLDHGEFAAIARRVPPEVLESHFDADTDFVAGLITEGQAEGLFRNDDPAVLAGVFRALFLVAMQREIIGVKIFPRVMEWLIHAVTSAALSR